MVAVLSKVKDWVATGASVSGVLGAMAVYDVIQRVTIRLGPDAHQRSVSGMARAINRATRLSGATFRFEGIENVARGKNYIIVANHQSMFDIAMASEYLADLMPRYVSKLELARGVPGVSYNLRNGGSVCIDRKDPDGARRAVREMAERVRDNGWSVMIFPEGTRSRTGQMRRFRPAGLRLLLEHAPGVEVLPVTCSGGSRLFATNLLPVVRNVDLSFRVHAPITPPERLDDASFEAFLERCERTIASALPEADREGRWGTPRDKAPRPRASAPAAAAQDVL